jgi:tetratricopeptide (TPR) repeat protein
MAVAVALFIRARPAAALTEQDTVVLAFENTTGDKVFDDTLPMALAIQLEQSPFLRLLSNERIRDILVQMKQPADAPITKAVGLEACERAGAAAVILGSVTPLGSRYVIGLQASSCASGDVIAREQVEVSSKDEVLAALGRAATRLRRGLGESRDSMARYDVPITEGTTTSLEALRALRQGDGARDRGQLNEALQHYRDAASRDPEFALAQSRLGTAALGLHYESEALAALERAYARRDRVTVPERLEIDLIYHANMTGDQAKVTDALQALRREYPRRAIYRRRLAGHNLDIGNFDDALTEALEARKLEPGNSSTFAVLARAYFALGRWAEARAVAEEAIARGVATEAQRSLLLQVGFVTGDVALVERERAWASTQPEAAPFFLEFDAEYDVWHGRLKKSLAALDAYQAWARQRGAEYRWIVLELRKARYEALCGMTSAARARMNRLLKSGTLDTGLKVDALKVAISAGDMTTARSLIAGFDAQGWPKVEQPYAGFVQAYRAAIETSAGQPRQALDRLAPFVPFELGLDWGLIPLHERALAHLKAGEWQQARDAFQKMLDHPGVFSGQKLLPSAQLGLARAFASGGQVAESRAAYETFLRLWKDADPDLPLIAVAKRELAAVTAFSPAPSSPRR